MDESKGPGRPTKYDPKYCDEIFAFFECESYDSEIAKSGMKELPHDLPMFAMFAHKIGVHKDTLVEWCKQHPEFSVAYEKVKQLQENHLVQNALRGNYTPAFSLFFAMNNLGYVDRVEQDINVKKDGAANLLDSSNDDKS